MKIYSNVNLFNNSINNFTTNNAIIGSSTLTADGAIKYDTTSHVLLYYSTEQVPESEGSSTLVDKGWVAIGSSESTTINNNVNGTLKIKKGTNATGNNFNATVAVNASNATNLMFDLETDGGKNGNLVVSDNGSASNRVVIDLLTNLSSQYGAAIIPTIIKTGSFDITSSHTYMPISVTIQHGLGTPNLDFSLYKKETVSNIETWSAVMCDYFIGTTGNFDISLSLTSGNITDIRGTYKFIIVGSSVAGSIGNNSITITQLSPS